MEINPNERTYFIVKLDQGSLKRLRIPVGFAKQWKGISRRIYKFKCENYQKILRVEIGKRQGSYYFSHGWRKFVKIHKLEERHSLVFFLIPPRTFEVLIYKEVPCTAHTEPLSGESNGCVTEDACCPKVDYSVKRRPYARGIGNAGNVKHKTEREEEVGEGESVADPYFTVTLKSYHAFSMILPKAFARETGIIDMENVVVIDEEGRRWLMDVAKRTKNNGGRIELTKGWSACRKANNLNYGDTYLFKFLITSATNVLRLQKIQK